MSDKATLSTDETIAVLNKTTLPTVIIEGSDDVIVYRKLEEVFADVGVSVMGAGGRTNLLKIFDRVDEITSKNLIAFIADKDMWVLSGLPEKYVSNRLVFTSGYSIENDVFQDCAVDKVMSELEQEKFAKDIQKFSHWYALVVNRINSGVKNACLRTFPGIILDEKFEEQTALMGAEIYPDELKQRILREYSSCIRGKSLMQIASRQLSRIGRVPRINTQFFLGTVTAKPGPNLHRIFSEIGAIFGSDSIF